MQIELAFVALAVAGLVAAAMVGAAVALIVSNRVVHRSHASREDSQAVTADQLVSQATAPVAQSRTEPGSQPFLADAGAPLSSTDEVVLPATSALAEEPWDQEAATVPASPSPAGAQPSAFSLPESPWDENGDAQLGSPAPTGVEGGRFSLPESPWDETAEGQPASPALSGVDSAAFSLPQAPWDQQASAPPAYVTPSVTLPIPSELPPDAWGTQDAPSPETASETSTPSSPDLTLNGAGRQAERLSNPNGVPARGRDEPAPRRSQSSDDSWGELPTESEPDDPTDWGSRDQERPK
jgi:hypothetical protein